ncbi:uncharacterized protein FIBRA_04954 [Fibroporia radiculosa]|uniref:Uncharacterized protein n=1 Tax=Fibroporia radiculosa TaxID=599839 RepID=J4HWT9_9APHY|nr:uncharacterized protein FIBRA_04954 [Fibroporia radiculosa]CCM02842.1 predicted protein [Fibroporia radiculosa]
MSSITFPNSPGFPSSASSSSHEMRSYSPAFDGASFQVNPLSHHPPRTPRPSVASMSTSSIYGTEMYGSRMQEETISESRVPEEDTETGDDERVSAEAEDKVRKEDILRELLKTSNGRDKAFKIIQYSLRMYLLFHSVVSGSVLRSRPRSAWEAELVKRCESTIAGFSLTRKCLILFNWLTPLTSILDQHASVPFSADSSSTNRLPAEKRKGKPLLHTFLHAPPPVLLELVNGLSDDVYTFARLGLIGKRLGERAGRFADWCWFAGTLVNLVENTVERSVILTQQHEVESRLYAESMGGATAKSNPAASKVDETELGRLQRQDYWIQVTRLKLLMDLIFVSYNVFNLKRAKSQIQTFAGLAAAALR